MGLRHQLRKQAVGQDAHILGEQAEEQADQEVRGRVRLVAVPPQELRQAGEMARGFLGHLARGLPGAQPVRIGECLTENLQLFGDQQVIQRQLDHALDGVGKVGVDDDALEIGDDQQRRVQQRLAVLEKLAVRLVQISVLALVLPGEIAHLPDVGPTLPAGDLAGAGLEGIPAARGVGLGRGRLAQQRAQVVEVRLAGRALLQRGVPPFGDEVLR